MQLQLSLDVSTALTTRRDENGLQRGGGEEGRGWEWDGCTR